MKTLTTDPASRVLDGIETADPDEPASSYERLTHMREVLGHHDPAPSPLAGVKVVTRKRRRKAKPCHWCLSGHPELCTGVGCYRCTCGCRWWPR